MRLAGIPGEMAELVRKTDWSRTPLGEVNVWTETALTTVAMVLSAQIPMQLFWGPDMVVFYNDALRPTLSEKHPLALGMPAREVWAEVWPQVGSQLEAVLAEKKAVLFSAVPLKLLRNGVLEEMYWDYSYSPILDPDGSVAGILNVSLNVTEIVRSRKSLEASEKASSSMAQQLGQVLDATTDAIVVVNREWVMTYLNPAAEKVYGPKDTILGRNVWQRFPDAIYKGSPFVEYYHRAMSQGVAGQFIAYYPDPLDIWIELEVYPTPDGIVTFSRDITSRRLIEQALEASERSAVRSQEELNLIINALPNYLSYLDTDYRYVRVNRTYEQWFRRSANEMIGKTIDEVLGPDAAGIVREQMLQAFAGYPRTFEYKIKLFDEERHLAVTHIPDFDAAGEVRGVIVQGQDITERKRAEAVLLQTEKLAAVGRLSASIAHEINNPLESVTNLLYLARRADDRTAIREYLDLADRELRRVSSITRQTLRFYRQTSSPTPLNSEELFESVTSIYQGRLVNSRIILQRDRTTAEPVECLEGEIRQVFTNLVGNAIDSMDKWGGRLILRSRKATEWHTGRKGVRFTVADTGEGMDASVRSRIFEAFYTTKGIGGTGLGLWVSREIIDRHKGTIRVSTARHRGTVINVFLPTSAAS